MFKAFCCGGVDILVWFYLNLPSLGLFGLLNLWMVVVAEWAPRATIFEA